MTPERLSGGAGRWRGADIDLGAEPTWALSREVDRGARSDLVLFGEAPSRVVVTVAPECLAPLQAIIGDLPHRILGRVTGAELRCTMSGSELFAVAVAELHSAYESLPERLV
jgi:hypothetical protein